MTGLFIFVHTVTCMLLITVILMQSGRGGGLTEGFAAAESMFGAKTNEFMIKATSVLTAIFLVTSLVLAHLSSKKEQSLLADTAATQTTPKAGATATPAQAPTGTPVPAVPVTPSIPATNP
jgi:preprotein translocase subunit SecG